MWRVCCKFMLKLWGWKTINGVMPDQKAIIIGVPHTSAWDFVISYLYYTSVGGIANIVTIAKATGAKVYLGFFDFGRKEVGWLDTIDLTDDAEADIKRMKAYYRTRGVVGKRPEWFSAED